jgi:hypothetical protein
VGRTLILDPAMEQGFLPPRRETGDPLSRLKGLAGQTVMMPEDDLVNAGKAQPQPSRAAPPARGVSRAAPQAASDEAPRGVVGGTQVLGAVGNTSAELEDDEQPDERDEAQDDEPDEQEDIRETEHVRAPRPGRRAAQTEPSSSGDAARAKQRLIVIGAGAAVLAIAVGAILVSRPSKPSHGRKEPRHAQPAAPEMAPPPPPEKPVEPEKPAEKPAQVPPPTEAVPPVEDNVRINLKRVPEGTEISVDGHPTTLPILIPRGRESHQIILRAADGTERALDVDGTRDRLIELAAPRSPAGALAPPAAPAPRAPPPSKPPAPVRPAAPPKESAVPAAAHAPAASKPAPAPAAAHAPAASKPAPAPAAPAGAADKKPKPRVSKEREAIIDL